MTSDTNALVSLVTGHNFQLSNMDEVLTGGKRRYHIESVVGSNGGTTVYRAFARRRAGQKIKRRYYALFETDSSTQVDFDSSLSASAMAVPFDVFEADRFEQDGHSYVVLAKGRAPRKPNRRWAALQNHGYLMLLLSALILILMIVKFFQSPVDQPIVENDKVVESVEAATE